jgi:hypothetical protein
MAVCRNKETVAELKLLQKTLIKSCLHIIQI